MADVATDATELARQLEDAREQQRAVSGVLRAVARSEGLQPVLDEVVEAATRLCEAKNGRLWLFEDGLLHVVANYGSREGYDFDKVPRVPDRTTMAGRAALTRDVVHLPDVDADPEYTYAGPRPFRSGLNVPILLEDELIGVLGMVRETVGPFADEHIELLKTFADQAAIAIANARLIDAVERQLEQQRAISDVLGAVARSEGLDAVFHTVVEAAARLCKAEYGEVHLVEGDHLRLAVGHGGPAEIYEPQRDHPHPFDRSTVAGRVALSREVVHIPDILEDPEYSFSPAEDAGIRTLLGAPILVEDELVGAFNVVRTSRQPFTEQEIDLLRTFADQAAIAIANARLIDAVERQLEQQRAVGDVLGAVARSEGLGAVFDVVVEAAARLCEAEYGQVQVADGDVFRLAGSYGSSAEVMEYERTHPNRRDRSTVVGRVAVTGEVVHIPDVLEDPEYTSPAQKIAGYRAMLGVPIILEGDLIGVINVVRDQPGPYGEEQIELVETFADQAAIAIANARLIEAVERQRTELSRFVSPQVADLLTSGDGERMLAGHRAYISCLFCDLRGSTSFTEAAEPEELFEVVREYHGALGELIPDYEGTLEHFAGDGLMVFFNDPLPVDGHELKAVRLALAAQERFAELAASWRRRGTELGLGIGISAGYATLGRIGFEGRYDYGALGPVTNLASRLSTQAEAGQTLISQRVFAAVEERVEAEPVGELELKGFGRPVVAYEVQGLR